MGIMAVGRIIALSVLIGQTLSAPSGCIESCNFYHTSYQSRASGGYQDRAGLIQVGTNLNDHDYAKPGNWTEHNQYRTEDGHGKVHEERGQYVEGPKKVRYYKKNYTSSYGTGNINGLGATELDDLSVQQRYDSVRSQPSSRHYDSQSTYGQSGQTVVKETGYNTVQSHQTQSSSTRIDSKSERLEDFGDSGYSQVNQHVPDVNTQTQTIDTQHHIDAVPGNWSRVDSYRTDGGHGRVFEEEGQYVTGPKKIRYYKKNYTSSYSTSGAPQINIGSTSLGELHGELQRNLQRELNNFRRESSFHESSSSGHIASDTSVGSTGVGLSQETVGFQSSNDLQTAESDTYRQQLGYRPSTGATHHYTDQQQHREIYTGTRQPLIHTYPASSTYGTESQSTYQSHQTYTSQAQPTPQLGYPTTSSGYVQTPTSSGYVQTPTTSSGYVQTPTIRGDYHQANLQDTHSSSRHRHVTDEIRHAEVFGAHQQSGLAQNQLLTQHAYTPGYGAYPSRHGESRHYEEHWSSSSHGGGHVAPERTADYVHGTEQTLAGRTHYDRDAYNEHRGRFHTAQGHNSHTAHTSESNTAFRTSSGQLVTGSLGLSHVAPGAADCTEETQQYQQETRYHRKYKRDDHHGDVQQHQAAEDFSHQELSQIADDQQSEDLTQQTQGSDDLSQQTSGKLEFGQQTVHDQHLEDLTQQTQGQLEFGQQTTGNQHLEDLTQQSEQFTQQTQGSDDLTQQTSGKLEFGQQTVDGQHLEDLTQQTQGQLEFGQQTTGNQHLEDLTQQSEQFTQQTQGSDDLTQQTSGKLEFGQQTVDGQHLEDLTQQTQGQLEFGQQTTGNQHLEDLTQQSEQFTQQTQGSDDLTQQTSGKLEFGQQTIDGQHLEDLTQQTQGQLEFGQQTTGNQHLEDLTQQSEQFTQQTQGSDDLTQQTSGKLEFGQQTVHDQHLEDLTQQTQGQLEFGQQTTGNQHLEDLTQQSEQFTQQTQGSDDLTQQTSGKLEFGQQTVDSQHLEDLTQQTQGQLEFGQQTTGNQHLEDLTQQSEQFTQQTQGSDDLTQQTSGKLEFGQQTVDGQHLEDLTQQTQGQLEFGQQTTGNQHLEDLTQQSDQFTQQTQGSDDLTQQTSGKLEFGQQTVDGQHLEDLTQQTQGQLEFGQQTTGNQHLEDLTQQSDQFTQQTQGSDDLTQQTSGKLEFSQQTVDGQHLEDLTQQTQGQLEFGQQTVGDQHLEDLTQQNEQFTQQTQNSNDYAQQTSGKLEFGQQSIDGQHLEQHLTELNQESEDLTQQTGKLDDFTQQTMGQMQFGQPKDLTQQESEDLTQQTGGFDDFTQQTSGYLEHHQQQEQQRRPGWSGHDTQYTGRFQQTNKNTNDLPYQRPSHANRPSNQWQLEQMSQQTDFDQDFTQQTDHQSATGEPKPAPKPKPRPRYHQHAYIPSDEPSVDNVFKPIEVNPDIDTPERTSSTSDYRRSQVMHSQSPVGSVYSNGEENIDRLHWMHKSNDASVGLQWHYTYHPSDLTNVEGTHYYGPNIDPASQQTQETQQQSRRFDFGQEETRGERTLGRDQQLGSFQQTETSRIDGQFNQNSEESPARVIPLQNSRQATMRQPTQAAEGQTEESKIEPRILEAFGGGPYDPSHTDDIYSRVTINPSATLPPIAGEDPWDIREKPREVMPWMVARTLSTTNTPKPIDTTTPEIIETTTQALSFWNRLGNKITNTYGKAKEKAREIFG